MVPGSSVSELTMREGANVSKHVTSLLWARDVDRECARIRKGAVHAVLKSFSLLCLYCIALLRRKAERRRVLEQNI